MIRATDTAVSLVTRHGKYEFGYRDMRSPILAPPYIMATINFSYSFFNTVRLRLLDRVQILFGHLAKIRS